MTHRTEANPPSPMELATADVVESISHNIRHFYKEHALAKQHGTTEPEFRRILALYFHDKSIADWCHDLHIQDATDPADKPCPGRGT